MSNLNLFPIGGSATALPMLEMSVAVAVHFLLGALMAFGIGLYAPSLILLSLLGLDPRLAFPIMASACAFLMPATGFSFVKSSRIDLRIVIGIAIGGIPATIVAALLVKEMPIVVAALGRGRRRTLCRIPAAALRHPARSQRPPEGACDEPPSFLPVHARGRRRVCAARPAALRARPVGFAGRGRPGRRQARRCRDHHRAGRTRRAQVAPARFRCCSRATPATTRRGACSTNRSTCIRRSSSSRPASRTSRPR